MRGKLILGFALALQTSVATAQTASVYQGAMAPPPAPGVSAPAVATPNYTYAPAAPAPATVTAGCADGGCATAGPAGCADGGCAAMGGAPAEGCGMGGEGCGGCGSEDGDCIHHIMDTIFSDDPLFGCLRNKEIGPLTFSAGGVLRHRYMNESNRFRPGGPAQSQYNLWRFTPFVDLAYEDLISVHVEGIQASALGYDAPLFPLGIDENDFDLLQGYVDVKLADVEGGGSLKYRYGRQFLQYGSQRLLSPLAWSNTFRNFEGHKLMYKGGDWAVDAFHVGSVNGAAGGSGFDRTGFDEVDNDRTVTGVYTTYTGKKNSTLDLYWLRFEEENDNVARMDGQRDTFGARIAGKQVLKEGEDVVGTWSWDLEGAYQIGEDDFLTGADQDVNAYFVSFLGGYTFNDACWTPSINAIFHYGSGDDDPTDGDINTVFTMYPLGHAYWGLIDNFSGQNLIDYGVSASVKPHKKFTFLAAWHQFKLAEANDALYNIAGAPFALASDDIGTEVDLVGTIALTKNINVQLGYFWFFYGDGVNNSGFARPDARQFYAQTIYKF